MTDTTDNKVETVNIVEPGKGTEKVVIKVDDARNNGMSDEEIAMGQKHGTIEKDEKDEDKDKDKKDDKNLDNKDKKDDKTSDKSDKKDDDKNKDKKDEDKTDEEEEEEELANIRKKSLKDVTDEEARKLTKNEQGYYWAQKKERTKRQTAEADRDFYKMRLAALEEKVDTIVNKKKDDDIDDDTDEEEDEDDVDKLLKDGDDKDDKKKGKGKKKNKDGKLTEEEWQKKQDDKNKELLNYKERMAVKLNEFEVEAQEAHPDLNSVLDFSTDIFERRKTMFKDDPDKLQLVEGKIKEWVLASADMLKPDSRNIAILAYEIGKLHPDYKADGNSNADDKKDGKDRKDGKDGKKISDDKMSNLLNKKGKTSASLSGNSTVVPVTELTLEQARNLSNSEWRKLPKEVRDKLMGKP